MSILNSTTRRAWIANYLHEQPGSVAYVDALDKGDVAA